MRKSPVTLKGNEYGVIVVLDDAIPSENLVSLIVEKFQESGKFWGDKSIGISFKGKDLSELQKIDIMNEINDNTSVNIVCIVEDDKELTERFRHSVDTRLAQIEANTGKFYKGTLRSGQVLEVESSIIVLGDVNPGAKIISRGNIVIIGALKGNVYAGASENNQAFVIALDMQPMQIRIGDHIARCPDSPDKTEQREAKIAFVEEGNIYIEPISKNVFNDIYL